MAKKNPKLAEIKTKQNNASVEEFIAKIPEEQKRKDSLVLLQMMKKASGEEPRMWGSSIIGFGEFRYESPATGRQVDWFRIGFSPRKTSFSLYLTVDIKRYEEALSKLGKHKTGAGCLYINKLQDVDLKVLEGMIKTAADRKLKK